MSEKRSTHLTSFLVAVSIHLAIGGILYYFQIFSKIEIPKKEILDNRLEMNFDLTKHSTREYSEIKNAIKSKASSILKPNSNSLDKNKNENENDKANFTNEEITIDKIEASNRIAKEINTGDERILDYIAPKYPISARRKGIEGVVTVQLHVNSNGDVEQLTITKPSGNQILDEAVINAVKKWKFKKSENEFNLLKTFEFKLK